MATDGHNHDTLTVDASAVRKLGEAREKITDQLSKIIVGQQGVIEELLICLFSRGHCLLEGCTWIGEDAAHQHAFKNA